MKLTDTLKEKAKRLKQNRHLAGRYFYYLCRTGYKFIIFMTSADYRNTTLSAIRYRKQFHQVNHYTEADRYPDLFKICGDFFSGTPNLRILSFGCSTGEEILSLSNYIPDAFIVGTDINKWCIRKCRQNIHIKNAVFIHSLSLEFKRETGFNAIFCLAVFQHPANRHDPENEISVNYHFQQFEDQLIILDEKLLEGGLLFIENADFNFLETGLSVRYSVLQVENNIDTRERPLYNKDNKKVSDITQIPRVFIKNS